MKTLKYAIHTEHRYFGNKDCNNNKKHLLNTSLTQCYNFITPKNNRNTLLLEGKKYEHCLETG